MILGPAKAISDPVPQAMLHNVAAKGSYVLDINPREVLINGVGMEGYVGGGNFWPGESAADLDDVLLRLSAWPRATIALETGTYYEQWTPMTVADVQRLRTTFFAMYGLRKPDYYKQEFAPLAQTPIVAFEWVQEGAYYIEPGFEVANSIPEIETAVADLQNLLNDFIHA